MSWGQGGKPGKRQHVYDQGWRHGMSGVRSDPDERGDDSAWRAYSIGYEDGKRAREKLIADAVKAAHTTPTRPRGMAVRKP